MRKGRGIPEGEMADAIICSEKGVSGHNGGGGMGYLQIRRQNKKGIFKHILSKFRQCIQNSL